MSTKQKRPFLTEETLVKKLIELSLTLMSADTLLGSNGHGISFIPNSSIKLSEITAKQSNTGLIELTVKAPPTKRLPRQLAPVESFEGSGHVLPGKAPSFYQRAKSALLASSKNFQEIRKLFSDYVSRPATRLTWSKRNTIIETMKAVQNAVGITRVAMYCLTLPGSSLEALVNGLIRFPDLLDLFHTKLAQHLRLEDGRVLWAERPELQKRGAPHIHGLTALPMGLTAASVKPLLQKLWFDCLANFSDRFGADLFERRGGGSHRDSWSEIADICVDVQAVKKDVARYYAKYSAKDAEGGYKVAGIRFQCGHVFKQYLYRSRDAKKEVDAQTVRITLGWVDSSKRGAVSDSIYEALQGQGEFLKLKTDPFKEESCGVFLDRSQLDMETIQNLVNFVVEKVEKDYRFSSKRMEIYAMNPLREAVESKSGNTDELTARWLGSIKGLKADGKPYRECLYNAYMSEQITLKQLIATEGFIVIHGHRLEYRQVMLPCNAELRNYLKSLTRTEVIKLYDDVQCWLVSPDLGELLKAG